MKKYDLLTKVLMAVAILAASICVTFLGFGMGSHAAEKDVIPPTLNAAVNDGVLSIRTEDQGSGVKELYVNGYKYTNLKDGKLDIRMQQFDTTYETFKIYAIDQSGNRSITYKLSNPYYGAEDAKLPTSAEATKPVTATGTVTEHTKEEQKKQALKDADTVTAEKEFYTITTESEKVFYLIIDRTGEEEKVYFLTEVSENDLLNVTNDIKETLPQNSVASDSAIPTEDKVIEEVIEPQKVESVELEEVGDGDFDLPEESFVYLLMGGICMVVIGVVYYFKFIRKKKEDFIEDEDEEDEDYEIEEDEVTEDDFFDDQEFKDETI